MRSPNKTKGTGGIANGRRYNGEEEAPGLKPGRYKGRKSPKNRSEYPPRQIATNGAGLSARKRRQAGALQKNTRIFVPGLLRLFCGLRRGRWRRPVCAK